MDENTIKILLIEDNPDDAELIKRKLARYAGARFAVTAVNQLHQGMEEVAGNAFDLIISDLGLPDSHGIDTVKAILDQAPLVPLVVLSGFDDEAIAIQAVQSGAQDYLVKGQLEGAQIERILLYAIERARLQRELEQHSREISSIQTNLFKILEKNADAIIVVSDDRRILFTNPAVETLLGRRQQELINQPFDFPLDRGQTTEIEIARPDKARTIAEMRVVGISWEGQPAYLATLRNVTRRRHMEEKLRQSEAFSTSLLEHAPNPIEVVNPDLSTKYVNKAFEELTGFTSAEVVGGKPPYPWVPDEVKKETGEVIKKDMADSDKKASEDGIITRKEILFRNKKGGRFWAEVSIVPIKHEDVTAYLLVNWVDITERKQAAEALRESQQFSSSLLENAPNPVSVVNPDGSIKYVNPAFEKLTGFTPAEAIGRKPPFPWWPKDTIEEFKTLLKDIMGGQSKIAERQLQKKSGELFWVEFHVTQVEHDGALAYLLINWVDVTEHRNATEAIRESEELFRLLFNSVDDMIFMLEITGDGSPPPILQVNDTACEKLGFSRDELLGMTRKDITTPEEWQNVAFYTRPESQDSTTFESILRGKDGRLIATEHNSRYLYWKGKRVALSVARDITERKKTEEALRFSDAAFKSLHESVIATDTDFNITHWNETSTYIYGIEASRAIGRKLLDVIEIAETYPGQNDKRFKTLVANGYFQEEQLHRTRHGEVWVDVSFQAIEDGQKRYGWVVLANAITQRKQAEEALKRSEEKYRELISTSMDGIVATDAQMRILVWNQGAERILGFREKEMLGQFLLTVIPDEYQPDIVREFSRLRKTRKSSDASKVREMAFLKKNGRQVPVELSISARKTGNNFLLTSIIRDITERKEAREKLLESEARFHDLFENANDLIQSCGQDAHFIYVNKAWREALGYSQEEIDKLSIWNVIDPDCMEKCQTTFRKIMEGESQNNVETIFVTKSGKRLHVEGNINAVVKDGQVVATRAIFRDITERKEAEEKLRLVDKMKSEFLSNVSHELRTPLQSISGFTKLIMNGQVPDAATQQEFLEIIHRETLHLGNLINSLLDMSRLESGRFQINRKLMPVRDTIIDPVRIFYSLAREKQITLSEDIPDQLPELEVDGDRLRQVVINLVGNAIKFSDPGGKVSVRVEKQPGQLLVQVSDRGIGIPAESQAHLFERFFRSEGEVVRGGTGLGLYISKQIIEAHGGRIWAESKIGEGSTFSFTLPLNGKGGSNNGKKDSHRRR